MKARAPNQTANSATSELIAIPIRTSDAVQGRLAVGRPRAAHRRLLNAAIPWDVEIVSGASKLQGKFSSLDLRSFSLTGGVDQMRLTLGSPTGDVPIRFTRGANTIRIERPTGAHLRLTLTGGAGRIDFDGQRLGRTGDTVLETTGASRAADRYSIDIEGGAGRITVAEVA